MRFTEISLDTRTPISTFLEIADEFCILAMEELEMEELPQITFGLGGGLTNTFGFYDLEGEIFVETLNRHPMDILRTLAHELTHHRQNVRGELHEDSGKDGSEHENEANAMAGIMLRKFAKARPDMFGLGPVGPDSILFEKVREMTDRGGVPYRMLQNPSQAEFDALQRRHSYFRGMILPDDDFLIWPSFHEIHAEMARQHGYKLLEVISLEGVVTEGIWDVRLVQLHDCSEERLWDNRHLKRIRHTLPWPFDNDPRKFKEVLEAWETEELREGRIERMPHPADGYRKANAQNPDVILYWNPTPEQIDTMFRRAEDKYLKALVVGQDLVVWDGYWAEHKDVEQFLNIPRRGREGKLHLYRTGDFTPSGTPTIRIGGWKDDAYRNIPALRRLLDHGAVYMDDGIEQR